MKGNELRVKREEFVGFVGFVEFVEFVEFGGIAAGRRMTEALGALPPDPRVSRRRGGSCARPPGGSPQGAPLHV